MDQLTRDVIGAAMKIHRDLGPGMLESVYELLLAKVLRDVGYHIDRQLPVDMSYAGLFIAKAFKIDLLVDKRLVLEIKSLERLHASHKKQLLTYLRMTGHEVGLLINFGEETLRDGIRRVVNGYTDSASSAASAPLREPGSYSHP